MVVKPSAAFLLDLASIVLTKFLFRFQDDFYLQVKGTAMGSKMAPNYACLYVGVFETDYFKLVKILFFLRLCFTNGIFMTFL